MLTRKDVERLDSIMNAILQRREARGFNVPDRDEDKIAEILDRWEKPTRSEVFDEIIY